MKRKIFSLLLCVAILFSYATQIMAEGQEFDLDFAISEKLVKEDTTLDNMPKLSLEYMTTSDDGNTYAQGTELPVVNTTTTGTSATDFYVGVKAENFKQFYWMEGSDRANYGIFQFAVGVSYDPEYVVPEPENRQEVFGSVVYSNEYNTMKTRMNKYAASPWKAMGVDLYEPTSSSSVNTNKNTVYVNMSMVNTYIDIPAAPLAVLDNQYLMFFKFRLIKAVPDGTNLFDFFAITDPTNTTSSVVMSFGSKGGHNITYNNATTQLQKYLALDTSNVDSMYPPSNQKHNVTIAPADAHGSVTVKQGSSAVTGEGNVYSLEEGKAYTVTASAGNGYRVASWSYSTAKPDWITESGGTLSINIPEGTVDSAIPSITANFEEDAYYMTIDKTGNGSVAVTQGSTTLTAETSGANTGKYKLVNGTSYTVTATADKYNKFTSWTVPNGVAKNNNTATFKMTSALNNETITAAFGAKTKPTIADSEKAKTIDITSAATRANISIAYNNGNDDYPNTAGANVKSVTLKVKDGAEQTLSYGTAAAANYGVGGGNTFVIYKESLTGLTATDDEAIVKIVMDDDADNPTEFVITIKAANNASEEETLKTIDHAPTNMEYTYGDNINLNGLEFTTAVKKGSENLADKRYKFDNGAWVSDATYSGTPASLTIKAGTKALTHGTNSGLTVADSGSVITLTKGGSKSTTEKLTINKKSVDVSVSGSIEKVYDSSTSLTANTKNNMTATVTGATGLKATVSTTGLTFTEANVNASAAKITSIPAANITLSDSANYSVGTVTADVASVITKRPAVVKINGTPSIPQGGNKVVKVLSYIDGKIPADDDIAVEVTGTFSHNGDGTGDPTVTLVLGDPTGASKDNYTLTLEQSSVTGKINNYYVESLTINTEPRTTGYKHGDMLDRTGMVFTEVRKAGTETKTRVYTWNVEDDCWKVTENGNPAADVKRITNEGLAFCWRADALPQDSSFNEYLYHNAHDGHTLHIAGVGENGALVKSGDTAQFSIGLLPVDVVLEGSITKVYDGTTAFTAQSAASVTAGTSVADVTATVDNSKLVFASKNVADGQVITSVNKTAITLSDTVNYEVGNVTANISSVINPLGVEVLVDSVPDYVAGDTNPVAVTDYRLSPTLIDGDDVTLNVTATYPSDVTSGIATVALAVSADGADKANYTFTIDDEATGNVTEAEVTEVKITAGAATGGTYVYSVDGGAETSADTEVAGVGKPVVVTVTPTDSSFNTSVTVRETNGSRSVSVKNDGNNKYSFEVPRYDVTITVLCSAPSSNGVSGGGTPSYSVKFDAGQYGTITGKSSISVSRNGKVTNESLPEVTAKEGYKFLGWSIDGKEVVDVTAAAVTKNVTYVALYEEVAEVTPSPEPTPAISEDYLKPYATGYDDGMFLPDDYITRAELAAMLARLINEGELETDYTTYFNDINGDEWYTKYIGFLESKGVMSGYEDGSFKPGQTITRAEMCAAIARAQGFALITNDELFTDIADSWAHSYIATLASKNIVTGYEDGSFDPQSSLTRAETVTIVNRLLKPSKAIVEFTPSDIAGHWAEAGIILAVNERELLD